MQSIKSELQELLQRNDLLRAAMLVGKVQDANFQPEPYVTKLLELSATVWNRTAACRKDPILKAQAINRTLFEEYCLEKKSDKFKQVIDDPTRYYLHQVMDKRLSSTLTTTLFYMILADQVGLEYECLALPSYYLLKVKDVVGDFYIDPFEGGKLLNQEEFQKKFRSILQKNRMLTASLFEKLTPAQMVGRLLQQLKHIYILKGSALEALRAVEMLLTLTPQSPELQRDRGILYCEMEYFSRAMEDLRFYLKERPKAEDVSEIKKLTSMLKGYREIMN